MSQGKSKTAVLAFAVGAVIAAAVWAVVATRGGDADADFTSSGSPEVPEVPEVPTLSEAGTSGGVTDSDVAPGQPEASDASSSRGVSDPETAPGSLAASDVAAATGSEEDVSAPVTATEPAAAPSEGSDGVAAKPSEPEHATTNGLAASAPVAEPETTETEVDSAPQGETGQSASDLQQGQMFIWHDGDREMRVWMQQDLTVNGAGEVVALAAGSDASGVPGAQAVFASESGGLMTLPGGVLVVFEAELSASEAEAFFAEVGVSMTKVSEIDSLPNGWFVETAPGLESLNLANTIASKPGVLLSSPNWEMGVAPQ